jgi:hypothetical protein
MTDDPQIMHTIKVNCATDHGRRRFCELFIKLLESDDFHSVEGRLRSVGYSMMPYREYLQTARWKELSKTCKERAGNRCQLCNSPHRLQTHHRTYERRGFENDGDLTVLCDSCHETFHANAELVK